MSQHTVVHRAAPVRLRGDDVDIPPALLNGVGVVSLLVVTYWLLITDRIVTGAAHRREITDKDEQIATLKQAVQVKDAQLEKVVIVGETTMRILTTVEAIARERSS